MRKTITQRELRNDSAAVLREVAAGETLFISRNGVPVAEIRPLPRRRFVASTRVAATGRRVARFDSERLRADLDELADDHEADDNEGE
jgi:prevent-host-death family protein